MTYAIPGFAEPVSSLSHLIGAGVFALMCLFLLQRGAGSWSRLGYLGVYALSGVFLLSMSGVYHLLPPGSTARMVLLRLDHSAIFALIAGTFTPAHGLLFRSWGRWGMLFLIWGLAATGITLKAIFFDDIPEWLSLSLYLGMGWLGLASGGVLWWRYGTAFIRPLLAGGIAYTLGGVLEFLRWPVLLPGIVGPHELFHVAVLIGVVLHWRFVYRIADGRLPTVRRGLTPCPAGG